MRTRIRTITFMVITGFATVHTAWAQAPNPPKADTPQSTQKTSPPLKKTEKKGADAAGVEDTLRPVIRVKDTLPPVIHFRKELPKGALKTVRHEVKTHLGSDALAGLDAATSLMDFRKTLKTVIQQCPQCGECKALLKTLKKK